MNNLLVRVLTGVLAGGAAVTMIVLSSWGLFVFCMLVSLLGLHEFYGILGLKSRLAKWAMLVYGLLNWAYVLFFFMFPMQDNNFVNAAVTIELNWLPWSVAFFGLTAVVMLFESKVNDPVRELGTIVLGYIYVFLPILLLFLISLDLQSGYDEPVRLVEIDSRSDLYNFRIPLGILFLTWAVDTFAYFGGKFLGKHPLWPRISPKKTWEGTIAGTLACVGLGIALDALWPLSWSWIPVAVIIAVLSQMGDLVESMYKRGLDIKDTSGILPGHGGIMDRFDGMYITVPIIYLYVQTSSFLAVL